MRTREAIRDSLRNRYPPEAVIVNGVPELLEVLLDIRDLLSQVIEGKE